MEKSSRIFISGQTGLVGNAIFHLLSSEGYNNLLYPSHAELDLTDPYATSQFFKKEKPAYIFLAAAKVGGIGANLNYPAEFLYKNLMIASHVIHQSYINNVKRLLFLGSSCIYPKYNKQPISEDDLLSGPLEYTNEPYAIAKIAGVKLCQSYNRQYGTSFISAMPCNLYGKHDNFNIENGHVIPALITRMHHAHINQSPFVEIWGTGQPLREFLHADDLARACLTLMTNPIQYDIVNIGSGEEIAIRDLALLIQRIISYKGELIFRTDKPDGTPRKVLDSSRIREMGWKHTISLEQGIKQVYEIKYLNKKIDK